MLGTLDRYVNERADFAFETTLATRTYAKRCPEWRQLGYTVILNYLRLPSVERSMERVARRTRSGGHDIPEQAIRRRFDKSWLYFETLYKPVVNHWLLYNSVEGRTEFVEEGVNP